MQHNPLVSIIIPVYNGADYLKDAIDSALSQTYQNIEVIVVNDGSTDDGATEAIAESYGDRVRYVYKENGGVSSALNLGIKESKGEYISWLSHDDMYKPHKLEEQVCILKSSCRERVIVYSDAEALNLHTNTVERLKVPSIDKNDQLYNIVHLLFSAAIHGCTLLIPRSCFSEVGLFNEGLRTTQDYELWFKLVSQGYTFVHVPNTLIATRWHEAQGTHSLSNIHHKELEALYVWAYDSLREEFETFSFHEIRNLVVVLLDRQLKKSADHIVRCWSDGHNTRIKLLIQAKTIFFLKKIYRLMGMRRKIDKVKSLSTRFNRDKKPAPSLLNTKVEGEVRKSRRA